MSKNWWSNVRVCCVCVKCLFLKLDVWWQTNKAASKKKVRERILKIGWCWLWNDLSTHTIKNNHDFSGFFHESSKKNFQNINAMLMIIWWWWQFRMRLKSFLGEEENREDRVNNWPPKKNRFSFRFSFGILSNEKNRL